MRSTAPDQDQSPARDRARAAALRRDRQSVGDVSAYSSAVRWLRFALPLAALAVLVGVFYSGRPATETTELVFRTGQFAALQGGLRLTNPRFTGATDAGEHFVVRADWAEPDGPDPKLVALSGVKGDIHLTNGNIVVVRAPAGEIAPKDQTIMLTNGVTLSTSDGYTLTTETLHADAETQRMESVGDVQAVGPGSEIEAGKMRVEYENDGVLWFERGVVVTLQKPSESGATGG